MANKTITQNFEEFIGLDLKSTALSRAPTALFECTNTRFGEGRSLRKREGYQIVGQRGNFISVFTYHYADPVSGESLEKVMALTSTSLFELKTANLTISSGTNLNYSFGLNAATNTYRLVINSNATPYQFGGLDYIDIGSGESPTTGTMGALQETIDAHATLVCAVPSGIEYAKIDGLQTGVSSVTVDAGHTYAIGDWAIFVQPSTFTIGARKVSAVGATSITFDSAIWDTVSVQDNNYVGPMAASAAGILFRTSNPSATGATSLNIPFYYWDVVPFTTFHYYFDDSQPFRTIQNESRPIFINANNDLYVYTRSYDSSTLLPHGGYPFKFDGQNLYREGLPQAAAPTVAVGSAGSLTGTYKYRYAFVQIDNQGNEIIGRISDETSVDLTSDQGDLTMFNLMIDPSPARKTAVVNGTQNGVTSITVDAGHGIKGGDYVIFYNRNPTPDAVIIRQISSTTNTTITIGGATVDVTDNDVIYIAKNIGFNTKGAIVNGAQTNTRSLTVENSTGQPNYFDVGDTLFFYDTLRDVYTTREITSKTATTLVWTSAEGEAVDVDDNAIISCNLRIRIYRTKAGGNIFYELIDIPHDYSNLTTTYSDNTADASLVVRLIEPDIGFEPDLPPRGAIACTHQGTRVISGIRGEPNTVGIYDPLNVEGISLASQYFDIGSNIEDSITALASDTDNSLAIFKPNAYYSANGLLASGEVSITTESEGDYGISSQASVAKIKGAIFGVGTLGVVVIQNRTINTDIGSLINPVIQNNIALSIKQAVGVNDFTKRGYHLYIPATAIGSEVSLFFDYENGVWFHDDWAEMTPSGGTAISDGLPYVASANGPSTSESAGRDGRGFVYRGLRLSSTFTQQAQLYADGDEAIERRISFLVTLGTPSIDKEFLRFKIWSLYNTGEASQFVTSSPTIRTYRNFQTSTLDTSSSMAFTASTIFEDTIKLKSNKARALQFTILDNTIHECLHLTGWEMVVALPYKEEDIEP